MIIRTTKKYGRWGVELKQDTQTFHFIDGSHTKEIEYKWVAKMLRIALKRHDKTRDAKHY